MDVSELNGETSFAVICSFFNKFGALLGLKPLAFTKIENLLSKFDGAGRGTNFIPVEKRFLLIALFALLSFYFADLSRD